MFVAQSLLFDKGVSLRGGGRLLFDPPHPPPSQLTNVIVEFSLNLEGFLEYTTWDSGKTHLAALVTQPLSCRKFDGFLA